MSHKLSSVSFQNEFVLTFPGDDSGSVTPRQTPGMLWSKAMPTPVKAVKLLGWSESVANTLQVQKPTDQVDVDILGGNYVSESMHPYAACYAGHQFGNWAGQLGDGRAITLGEIPLVNGQSLDLQLKGAGPTAYSRRADGRAVLRSSVREYLMSEAMHHLGVPTTRALSLVSTGDQVLRDMFYDGHPAYEPGAIVARVAPTFLRFGNFEMLAARGEIDLLQKLVDWTISHHYPHINGNEKVLAWFKEVVDRTAQLMAEWHRVGFVHGVMNTDNMSILGLTIDYGPYSFIDNYDRSFTPNTTDLPGRRYAFGEQAAVAKWNLGCLGGALAELFADKEELVKIIDGYDESYWRAYYTLMGKKLGLDSVAKEEAALIQDLDLMLQTVQPDMTIFYQELIVLVGNKKEEKDLADHFSNAFYNEPNSTQRQHFLKWVTAYLARIEKNILSATETKAVMLKANPRFILRNYLLHQAGEELERGDDRLFRKLEEALQEPYSDKFPEFYGKRPEWANEKAGCSMLSCSS